MLILILPQKSATRNIFSRNISYNSPGGSNVTRKFLSIPEQASSKALRDRALTIICQVYPLFVRSWKAALKANGACRVIWFNDGEHEVSMAMPKMAKEVTEFIDQSLRRNYISESAGCGYSVRFNNVQYGNIDLREEAKRWRGQTALGLIKANLQK